MTPPTTLNAESASHSSPSRWTCPFTRAGSGCIPDPGPTICLPHLLQNTCPGCIAAPHPSQNMNSSLDGLPTETTLQNIYNRGYVQDSKQFPSRVRTVPRGSLCAHRTKCKNEKATRQQGGLFFKGE